MTTTRQHAVAAGRYRIVLSSFVALAIVAGGALYFGWRTPPQMGSSQDVFTAVDALFTAIGNQDAKRLGECESRLRAANEAGKLPSPAWDYIRRVIAQARSGGWRPAAETLYKFMLAQQRKL